MKVFQVVALSMLILSLMGCGGGADRSSENGAGAAVTSFGDVTFTTYTYTRFRLVFISGTKIKKTWTNMVGPAVVGGYIRNGNEIEVQWHPETKHHGSLSEKFRQMRPFSMARYVWVDRKGEAHDDSPQVLERTEPKCDTVRVTN